jgi:hypothetical protein
MEPLTIVRNMFETSKLQKNELWFASFDISKAFDSVNINSLEKSLERIKIPKKLIRILINTIDSRKLKILTNDGLTDTIKASKGLDQGDTLSPLLWSIFYDPLITRLTSGRKNSINALAYMDDLALIENNFKKLQRNSNIFDSFLKLNSIKCNYHKTKLVSTLHHKNPNRKKTLEIGDQKVEPEKYNEGIKYLGCFFSGASPSRATAKKYTTQIHSVLNKVNSITTWNAQILKQVVNWVIPPTVAYANHVSVLTLTALSHIQSQINIITKRRFGLEQTLSNKIGHSPAGLNIPYINHTQDSTLIKQLCNSLINAKTRGSTVEYIRAIQANQAIWACPLCEPNSFKPNTWLVEASKTLDKYKIKICTEPCEFSHPQSHLSIRIHTKTPLSPSTSKFLTSQNIRTLADVLKYNSNEILTWKELSTRTGKSIRGKVPK